MIISDYYSIAEVESGYIFIENGDTITFYPPEWLTDIIMSQPTDNDALTAPMFDDFEIEVFVKSASKSEPDYAAPLIIHSDGVIEIESFHLEVGINTVYAIKYHVDGGIQLPLMAVNHV
jgi:hypothetical protein